MEQKKLGCLSGGGYLALLAAALSVALAFFTNGNRMFSPGDLNAQASGRVLGGVESHADLIEDCGLCHPAPWDRAGQSELCLNCHLEIAAELSETITLHGVIQTNRDPLICRECHGEHLGSNADLTFYSGEGFPHELVSFSLIAHSDIKWSREITCVDCHQDSYSIFDTDVCADCHLDLEPAIFPVHIADYSTSCLACHDGLETIQSSFDHYQTSYPLTGKHLAVPCADCHRGNLSRQDFQGLDSKCAGCHILNDPHKLSLGENCEICHTTAGWPSIEFDHTQTSFALDGAHLVQPCLECHLDLTFPAIDSECVSCHGEEEPHAGIFGEDCAVCHSTDTWAVTQFDHSLPFAENCRVCHQTDSPQDHYTAECSACHTTDSWLPAWFNHAAEGATDCLACHTDDRPSGHFSGQCSLCHSTSRWKPSTINHTFPTSHGGASNQCNLCHPGANYYGYSCYECHEHSRSEVRKDHENISNLENCLRCHWDGRKHEDDGDDD